jgi:hypothetical protein
VLSGAIALSWRRLRGGSADVVPTPIHPPSPGSPVALCAAGRKGRAGPPKRSRVRLRRVSPMLLLLEAPTLWADLYPHLVSCRVRGVEFPGRPWKAAPQGVGISAFRGAGFHPRPGKHICRVFVNCG